MAPVWLQVVFTILLLYDVGLKAQTMEGCKPPPLQSSLRTINAKTLEFTWDVPITSPDCKAMYYNILVHNETSATLLHEERMDALTYVHSMRCELAEVAQTCTVLAFTITATNSFGASDPTTVVGHFPIAPGPFPSEVEAKVVHQTGRTPAVTIHFQPPQVCPDQWATYSIIASDIAEDIVFTIGPKNYSTGEGVTEIMEEINTGLKLNNNYDVRVTVDTIAGSRYVVKQFSTTPDLEMEGSEDDGRLVIIIAAAAVGSCSVLAALGIICTVVVTCYINKQRVQIKKRNTALSYIDAPNYQV